MKQKKLTQITILATLVSVTLGYFVYKNYWRTFQLLTVSNSTTNWNTVNMEGCSIRHTDFTYEIKTPGGWAISKTQNDQNRTVYTLDGGENINIEINCDTAGIGGVICVDGGVIDTPFKIDSFSQNGCYWKTKPETAHYTVDNPFGSFVFSIEGVEKLLLDQILSTFTFIQ
jgi:hypothetical protein